MNLLLAFLARFSKTFLLLGLVICVIIITLSVVGIFKNTAIETDADAFFKMETGVDLEQVEEGIEKK